MNAILWKDARAHNEIAEPWLLEVGDVKCRLRQPLRFLALVLSLAVVPLLRAQQKESRGFGNPDVWHWPPSRTCHVENYRLVLRFDESKGEVFGDETIRLRPLDAHFRTFYLNSNELTIESVELVREGGAPVRLKHVLQGSRLWITLDRAYDAASPLRLRIAYHGFPRTGLFFVNPSPDRPHRPQEVFSQGEPEFNEYWFPCWDYPNDMATSETVTTVPEGQVVVSNGKLVGVKRAGAVVTYDWVENVPHSSYLISIAVGPWRKVSDRYKDTPVDDYAPRTVDEATVRRSFHLTPDMIRFFSKATGVEYPYEQYAQTTVHNYMFGGQENVSATTLTDATLHDERADQDYPSTDLVSHELGQHWFGDLVQGRDWADIWLNEGFATYLEALYTQHEMGYDAYRFAVYNDQQAEQMESREAYSRPILDRHYDDPLAMFDATTHEKGAAVLDMLRYVIDGSRAASAPASQKEPFFRALHRYLIGHRGHTVDTADLIDAIRATTGQELGWFFHQWVSMRGRPEYRVEASYDAARKMETVSIAQTQQATGEPPVFEMPIDLAFYGAHGESKKVEVRDDLRRQEFDIALDFAPQWVDFDPDGFIDKTLRFTPPLDALIAEAEKDPSMISRLWAVEQLGAAALPDPDARAEALDLVLHSDRFYAVRAVAASGLGKMGTRKAQAGLLSCLQQPDSRVRTAAAAALSRFSGDPAVFGALVNALHHDSSYAVEAAAAQGLGKSGVVRAFEILKSEVQSKPEIHVMQAALSGLAATEDPRAAEILLAEGRPVQPERVRIFALAGLRNLSQPVAQTHRQGLVDVVRAALQDPFYPVQREGEELAGAFHLTEFEGEIQREAERAPMALQRKQAQTVLEQLRHER